MVDMHQEDNMKGHEAASEISIRSDSQSNPNKAILAQKWQGTGVQKGTGVRNHEPGANPIAALIRKGALEAGLKQGSNRAATKVQRMINSLQWRQAHSKDDFYPLALESGKVLEIKQLQCGEVTGLGTGATVWPAAHVLAKYLERRYGEGGLRGSRVVDLGSGTGVEGIVAAVALGAQETFLTDQEHLLFLMRENAERSSSCGTIMDVTERRRRENDVFDAEGECEAPVKACHGHPSEDVGVKAANTANSDSLNGDKNNKNDDDNDTGTSNTGSSSPPPPPARSSAIHVLTYDWGMKDDQLSPPLDVILVSDCVLPKLYPMEPLVDAIDKLSGRDTVTFLSYEHRHYQAFDPRRKFEELVTARGFTKTSIPQDRQHPIFSADDIEIWEVRRRPQQLDQTFEAGKSADGDDGLSEKRVGHNLVNLEEGAAAATMTEAGEVDVIVRRSTELRGERVGREHDEIEGACTVSVLGETHELSQSLSGSIGSYLWPSALVMARHLVRLSCCPRPSAAAGVGSDTPGWGDKVTSCIRDTHLLSTVPDGSGGRFPDYPYPAKPRALELGSGVGLVAMTATLLGWDVVATDKADVLPLLRANLANCLSSTKRACVGSANVVQYEWGGDSQALRLAAGALHNEPDAGDENGDNHGAAGSVMPAGGGYDIVMCADCVYAKSSVEPLLATLSEVCDEATIVLVTNELRSAFDEFLRAARVNFSVESLEVSERDMVVDDDSNLSPTPVALKILRRRKQPTA